jgi:UDP-2,3-diacylglucosamine pyrophosphatase LpxH
VITDITVRNILFGYSNGNRSTAALLSEPAMKRVKEQENANEYYRRILLLHGTNLITKQSCFFMKDNGAKTLINYTVRQSVVIVADRIKIVSLSC